MRTSAPSGTVTRTFTNQGESMANAATAARAKSAQNAKQSALKAAASTKTARSDPAKPPKREQKPGEYIDTQGNQVVAIDGDSGRASATEFIARCQPALAQELVRVALARKISATVKMAALLEGLTIGGTRQLPGKVGAPPSLPAAQGDLQAFIQAGAQALAMRKQAAEAQDAQVVSESPAVSD